MAVYVDNAFIPFGRMLMSHMTADELDELHEMAAKLGLKRSWFQDKSIPHYDVSKSVRARAIALGAIEEDIWSEEENNRVVLRERRRKMRAKQRARKGKK